MVRRLSTKESGNVLSKRHVSPDRVFVAEYRLVTCFEFLITSRVGLGSYPTGLVTMPPLVQQSNQLDMEQTVGHLMPVSPADSYYVPHATQF